MNRSAAVLIALACVLFGVSAAGAGAGASTSTLRDAVMVSATTGWALTDTTLIRTTDGGRRWSDRTPPGLHGSLLQVGVGSSPVAFRGPRDGWLAVSSPGRVRVFRTADGGVRWRSATVSPSKAAGLSASDIALMLALDFVNGREGWLLTSAVGAAAGSQDVELYRTVDGGAFRHYLRTLAELRDQTVGHANPRQFALRRVKGAQALIAAHPTLSLPVRTTGHLAVWESVLS